ncbi:hypothetical protein ABW19_dt0206414 [Dactylella cylindrospora]|nr:hypothetical protein ABW19_dt0206414 [Dactylella cylindrospora]
MRATFDNEKLLTIQATMIGRGDHEDWKAITLYEDKELYYDLEPHHTWSERYQDLLHFGVSVQKVEEIKRLREQWVEYFHINEKDESEFLRRYCLREQLVNIARGAMEAEIAKKFDNAPNGSKHHELGSLKPPFTLERVLSRPRGKQVFEAGKEIWFPNSSDFRDWITRQDSAILGFSDADFTAPANTNDETIESEYLEPLAGATESITMYHGLDLGSYKHMVYRREFYDGNPSPGDLHYRMGLYFTNNPLYALAWATLKAVSYAHLGVTFDKLIPIVISVKFSPSAVPREGVFGVKRQKAGEYIDGCLDEDVAVGLHQGPRPKFIVGPFQEAHLAEMGSIASESAGELEKGGVQQGGRFNEYIGDVDGLRQIAVIDAYEDEWLENSNVKVKPFAFGPSGVY